MWETIKNDPLLKAVTIIVLGVLAFGFAFNIMFGGGGYSLNTTIGYTLVVLIKVVLIIAVIGTFILVAKMVNKYVIMNSKFSYEELKNDPLAKQSAIAVATLIGLSIIYSMFYGTTGNTMAARSGMDAGEMMGSSTVNAGVSLNSGLNTVAVLVLLIKFLLIISVIGLIIGLIMYLKASLLSKNSNNFINNGISIFNTGKTKCQACGYDVSVNQKFCPECGTSMQIAPCQQCGKEMKASWKCCPECGHENVNNNNINENF